MGLLRSRDVKACTAQRVKRGERQGEPAAPALSTLPSLSICICAAFGKAHLLRKGRHQWLHAVDKSMRRQRRFELRKRKKVRLPPA
jgi:hypothetical protein